MSHIRGNECRTRRMRYLNFSLLWTTLSIENGYRRFLKLSLLCQYHISLDFLKCCHAVLDLLRREISSTLCVWSEDESFNL